MIRLSPFQLADLIERSAHFDDPFGLRVLAEDMGLEFDEPEYIEDAQDALSVILEGQDASHRGAIARLLQHRPTMLLDRVTAELCAAACCDPAAACAIAIVMDERISIEDAATGERVLFLDDSDPPDSPSCLTQVWVAPGIQWDTVGTLRLVLPDLTFSAAIGRPLKDVVTHPVLDRHPLVITGIGHSMEHKPHFQTDADRTPLTIGELLAIRPT